jgi:predicted nucleic acid-binding protein
VDANILVYYFAPDPVLGRACEQFLERIENQEIQGYLSAHVLADMAHRLMPLEACAFFGWVYQGIAARLKAHPAEVQQLSRYRQGIDEVSLFGLQILPVSGPLVSRAADITRQTGLLCGDALIIATMQAQGLTHLASHDADFDRVPGITRYAPA